MDNHSITSPPNNDTWLINSIAFQNITSNLSNLSLHYNYEGLDDVILKDGSSLVISHIGSIDISCSNSHFSLTNVLCVPSMQKNLIYVSQFCKTNNTYIQFFSTFFVVKDLCTGEHLLCEQNEQDVYEWPRFMEFVVLSKPSPITLVGIKASPQVWHYCLGHLSNHIVNHLVRFTLLSLSSKLPPTFYCESCPSHKSHYLPFGTSSLQSCDPLGLIYTDVWGSSLVMSIEGFTYYVIFFNHFKKYIQLYPLCYKSNVIFVFNSYKTIVEKFFKTSIATIYSKGGGEFQALKFVLENNGIQHLKTSPHTPQHNSSIKRRHCHVVETGLTLLHTTSLPLYFWFHA